MTVPRVVLAAPASGHGTTTVAAGLRAAFAARGTTVARFTVGPDPDGSGRSLDPVLVGEDRIAPLVAHGAAGAGLAVVEGVAGLYDGRDGDTGSTAHVARLLSAPVVLVVDAAAQGRSVAALVHGFRTFGDVRLAGVILNRVGSDRHEELLRDACEEVGTPVLGALRDPDGIAAAADLDAVAAAARAAPPLTATPWTPEAQDPVPGRPVVALAGGPAFPSGYAETAELLAGAGADVVVLDPLRDDDLPEGTRALVVAGGFAEGYAAELSANAGLRAAVAALAARGAPIVAEGPGLPWLCRDLDGVPMCGVIDAEAATTPSPVIGYRDAVALTGGPLGVAGTRATGHENHRTVAHPRSGLLLSPAGGAAWAWRGADPEGFAGERLHASYLRTHWAGRPETARTLVAAAAA